jgi:hypothetical protein
MKRTLAIVFGLLVLAAPAFAQLGPNPNVSLAMHTVASYDYLFCPELMTPVPDGYLPWDCSMIDNSATVEEMDASYGYVYVVFLAYNIDTALNGVEYCVMGWPVVRGSPPVPLMNYCPESSLVLGNPLAGGGIQTFGGDTFPTYPTCGNVLGFAWITSGLAGYPTALPITLDYCASAYSYPADPHNYVLGPAPDFMEDSTNLHFGCTIGGMYPILVPYEDCNLNTAVEPTTWSGVKSMYR